MLNENTKMPSFENLHERCPFLLMSQKLINKRWCCVVVCSGNERCSKFNVLQSAALDEALQPMTMTTTNTVAPTTTCLIRKSLTDFNKIHFVGCCYSAMLKKVGNPSWISWLLQWSWHPNSNGFACDCIIFKVGVHSTQILIQMRFNSMNEKDLGI